MSDERTSPGVTYCASGAVNHREWNGMHLTPKIEVVETKDGPKAKTVDGVPIARRDGSGRIVWALPGGGEVIL